MLVASETRSRFVVEDGKMKCNLAGRTRGKRCGSTLMIDGSMVCSAGHKFTLDELAAATLQGRPNALTVRAFLAAAGQKFELAQKLAETALNEKFSPPFSMPATKAISPADDHIYRWMDSYPDQFVMLLQLADWWYPNYAEALRKVWVERSGQNQVINKALRKLNEEAERGNFQSQMLRDHLINCAVRSANPVAVSKKAMRYHMLIEALKVNGDTDLLWLYEDSLKELSMMRREPKWHPIIFEHDERSAGRMVFYLYLRVPDVDSEAIDGQLQIRLYDHGYVDFKAYSGMFNSSPSHDAVNYAIKRTLIKHEGLKGDVLEVRRGCQVVMKDDCRPTKEHWQLDAVKDLRHWLCGLKVEPDAE
jgi:hypothetical protein